MAAESTQESNRANLGDLASFETMDARAYLHTYWPPELPMDSEDKFMQHFLHHACTKHKVAGGVLLDVGSAGVVDKYLVPAAFVEEVWALEYLRQNRQELLLWLEAADGCFDWGKCVRYVSRSVMPDRSPASIEEKVREKVVYVGPVDLFDTSMTAGRLPFKCEPDAGVDIGRRTTAGVGATHNDTTCHMSLAGCAGSGCFAGDGFGAGVGAATGAGGGSRIASAPADDSTPPLAEGVSVPAGGEGGVPSASSTPADRPGAGAGIGLVLPAKRVPSSSSPHETACGVWRHGRHGPRPGSCISVLSLHSVIECISRDYHQFCEVLHNAVALIRDHPGCVLMMTVNTNAKSWLGGNGRRFVASNVSRTEVVEALKAEGFEDIDIMVHAGSCDTEMQETVGISAVWRGKTDTPKGDT